MPVETLRDYAVTITVRTVTGTPPQLAATLHPDGRWSFVERIRTTSAERAIEYFKHLATTRPVPQTLELVCDGIVFNAALGGEVNDGEEG